MARISFTFVGTVSHRANLDTKEFAGLTAERAEAEVRRVLSEIGPNVSFFEDDIQLAVSELLFDANA